MEPSSHWVDRIWAIGSGVLAPVVVVVASRWLNRKERAVEGQQKNVQADTQQSADHRSWIQLHIDHLEEQNKGLEAEVKDLKDKLGTSDQNARTLMAENLDLYRRLSGDVPPRRPSRGGR